MKKLNRLVLLILLSVLRLSAEDLNLPESIAYDAVTNQYFISNAGSGKILKMNENGELTLLAQGLTSPRGMVLINNTIYFTANKSLQGIDKNSGEIVLNLDLQQQAYVLNDICYDGTDKLYFSDMGGNAIFSYSISNSEISKLNLSSEIISPNGLYYENGNLICVSFSEQAPIYSINLTDFSVTALVNTNYDYLDGIAKDENNNFYVSSWGGATGSIHKYNSDFTSIPSIIKTNLNGPADIFYRSDIKTLIVPLFNDNMIDFILTGAPQKVSQISPKNDTTLEEYKVKFEWHAIAGVNKYKLEISKSQDFSSILSSMEYQVNFSDLITLDTSTKYYWRVSASNLGQWGEYSDIWHFTTGKMIYKPPVLLSPKNSEESIGLNPYLIWSKSSAGIYEVELSENIEFSPCVFTAKNLLDTTIRVSPALFANRAYYWRVRTYSGIVASEWSPISIFYTYNTPPDAPELLYPTNSCQNVPKIVTFEWSTIKNATNYKMQLSSHYLFVDSLTFKYDVEQKSTAIQRFDNLDSMKYSKQYWWKVRSINAFGEGNWSDVYSFYTIIKDDDTTKSVTDLKNYVTIGPNPATDYLNISTGLDYNTSRFEIIDCNGNKVHCFDLISENHNLQSKIDIKYLNPGAYILNIISNGKSIGAMKFIKN